MKPAHLISDELFEEALKQFQAGNEYIAYNSCQYLLDKGDMAFFSTAEEAQEFVFNNHSDRDLFNAIRVSSVMELYDHFEIERALAAHPTLLSQLNMSIMEENNFEYLAKQMQWVGLGDGLKEQLKEKMATGAAEFSLAHQTSYGKDHLSATLLFRKSDSTEMYFFNRMQLELKNEQHSEPLKQIFYIQSKRDNITLKEGYNLMSGRAVFKELANKEGERYNAWVQLDFKQTEANGNYKLRQFNDNYGFKLDAVLTKYPIAALKDETEKAALIESLERGNRQAVMFETEGKQTRVFIEASPQYKGINFYDQHLKKMMPHEIGTAEKQGQDKKENLKQTAADDDIDGPRGKRKSRRQAT